MNRDDLVESLFILVIAVIVIVGIVSLVVFVSGVPLDTKVADQCIQCGYPDHKVSNGIGYCIRLENGTEIVRPVSEACSR